MSRLGQEHRRRFRIREITAVNGWSRQSGRDLNLPQKQTVAVFPVRRMFSNGSHTLGDHGRPFSRMDSSSHGSAIRALAPP
jgi:hypothetical protein